MVSAAILFWAFLCTLLVRGTVPNDGTQAAPGMERVDGVIGVTHTVETVGDEVIDRQFSVEVGLHQFRDIPAALESTKGGALPNLCRWYVTECSGMWWNDCTKQNERKKIEHQCQNRRTC